MYLGLKTVVEWETSAGCDWKEGETDGLRSYVCKSCGGEIVVSVKMPITRDGTKRPREPLL